MALSCPPPKTQLGLLKLSVLTSAEMLQSLRLAHKKASAVSWLVGKFA